MEQILHELRNDQIQWALERVDTPERIDLLGLNDFQLFDHAELLQREIRVLRAVVTASLEELHHRDREIERQRREASRLRDELRTLRRTESAAA